MAQPPDKNPFASPRPGTSGGTASTDPKGLPAEPSGERRNEQTLLLSDVPSVETLFSERATQQTQLPAATQTFASDSSVAQAAVGQRYEILGEAGRGSMGNVYKARDRETGEVVALKLLKPEIASDQAMMERFKNELLFARRITHKNVCRVYDFNRFGSVACTSMEYVEGESLRSVISRFGGLPVRKATDVALQICAGLKEAHAQGIVHRDLKPENVMMDAQGRVKLMDFGIARSMEAVTRLTGAMVGTPAYMAPEQVSGKEVDYRTDIYSLGLILFEMFTGRQAFQADTAIAMAMKQMRDAPPVPREVEPLIPAHIERTILRCLEKEPARRFATVEELEKALRGTATAAPAGGAAPKFPGFNFEPVTGTSAATNSAPQRAPRRHHSPFLWFFILVLLIGGAAAAQVKWPDWETRGLSDARTFWHATKQHAAQDWKTAAEIKAEHEAESAAQTRPAPGSAGATPRAAIVRTSAVPGGRNAGNALSVKHKDVFPLVELPGKNPARPQVVASSQAHPAQARQKNAALASDGAAQAAPTGAGQNAAATAPAAPGDPFPNRPATAGSPGAAGKAAPADKSAAAAGVQQRADRAFHENPARVDLTKYLWVGRFEREERADKQAKRIRDLGLSAAVVPRNGPQGQFYIVVSGPFGPDQMDSVQEWLKTQGFPNVHPLQRPNPFPGLNQNQPRGAGGAPTQNP